MIRSRSSHDTFTRSDPAASRGFPLARHPGFLPRRTSSHHPGVARARGAGPAASAGPGPGSPGLSFASARSRPSRDRRSSAGAATRSAASADPPGQGAARRRAARDGAPPATTPADPAATGGPVGRAAARGCRLSVAGEFHAQAPRQRPAAARTRAEEDGVLLQHQLRRRPRPRRPRSAFDRGTGLHPRHRPLLRARPVQSPVDPGPATARSRVNPRPPAACRPGAEPAGHGRGGCAGSGAGGRGRADGAARCGADSGAGQARQSSIRAAGARAVPRGDRAAGAADHPAGGSA